MTYEDAKAKGLPVISYRCALVAHRNLPEVEFLWEPIGTDREMAAVLSQHSCTPQELVEALEEYSSNFILMWEHQDEEGEPDPTFDRRCGEAREKVVAYLPKA